jgi:hypothetical protein
LAYLNHANYIESQDKDPSEWSPILIPNLLRKHLTLRGGAAPISFAGRALLSNEDRASTVVDGWYNYPKSWRKLVYNRDFAKNKLMFYGPQEQKFNDCVIHAVNYYLNEGYFVHRKQVIRFLQLRTKKSLADIALKKEESGINISSLKKLYIVDK